VPVGVDVGGDRFDGLRVRGLVEAFAPGHLLHQEFGWHRGVVFGADGHAAELAQVGRALQRILQAFERLVDPHRPLHRRPLRRGATGGKAVGMDLGLQDAPPRSEIVGIEREPARQVEESEVVAIEKHCQKREGPAQRARHESAKRHA
jgi:hypothetical protein